MTDVRYAVKLHLETEVPDGLSYMECPNCEGKDKLMLIPLDEGGFKYTCLRASCDTWGSIWTPGTRVVHDAELTPKKRRRTWEVHTQDKAVQDTWFAPSWSATKIRFPRLSVAVLEELHDGMFLDGFNHSRWIFPIRGPLKQYRGYTARTYHKSKSVKKSLTRPFTYGPLLAWYGHHRDNGPLTIVEDQVSAAYLGQYFPTVALLGTHMSDQDIQEVTAFKSRGYDILIALDNDAIKQGVRLSKRIPDSRVAPLTKDIKDMSLDELQQFVLRYRAAQDMGYTT